MHTHSKLKPALVALAILAAAATPAVQADPVAPQQANSNPGSSPQPPADAGTGDYHLFAALPDTVQKADSGITLGVGILHQHYAESHQGRTLDSERGSMPVYDLGLNDQHDHFGWGVDLQYADGKDHYNGAILQGCGANGCLYTPYQSTTGNKMVDAVIQADFGFLPLNNLAVIPEVYVGEHYWHRDVGDAGSQTENYNDLYYGGGLKLQYGIGPVVLGLEGRLGRTFAATLTTSAGPGFQLGDRAVYSVGFRAGWQALSWLGVFASDTYGSFGYGASGLVQLGGGLTAQEPASRTQQNVVEIGIKLL